MSTFKKGEFNVRARSKRHLEALIAAHEETIGQPEIVETVAADYRWRIMLTVSQWHKLAEAIAREVDYSNFKNECHRPGAGADDIGSELMQIWSIMNRYQMRKHQPASEDGFGLADLFGQPYESEEDAIAGDLWPEYIEDDEEEFDFSELEHDLQTAGSRGVTVRPSLEQLPDDWQERLEEWLVDTVRFDLIGDDAYLVTLERKSLNEMSDEAPVEIFDEEDSAGAPAPARSSAVTAEQAKIDAILAEERAKTPDGQLHDRGPGDKPFKPDFHDQRDPQLGIIGPDGRPKNQS